MEFAISFPGGVKVDAHFRNYIVHTDQPKEEGGDATAPSPFMIFLASLATCAGFYALRFCQTRDLPTEGMKIRQNVHFNKEIKRLEKVTIEITLPQSFPEKYLDALVRAVDQCTVKRTILNPPEIEVVTNIS